MPCVKLKLGWGRGQADGPAVGRLTVLLSPMTAAKSPCILMRALELSDEALLAAVMGLHK